MHIGFYAGKAWEKWNPLSPVTVGIGGSESCLIYLGKELVKLGYQATLYIDIESATQQDGVTYLPFEMCGIDGNVFDFFIHFRNVAARGKANSKCHIGIAQDVTMDMPPNQKNLNGVLDYLVGLSEEHLDFLSTTHNFPKDKLLLSANGVVTEWYDNPPPKNRHQAFYSSCPSRDLDRLLWYSQDIVKQVPDFKLMVGYGFQTWEGQLRQGRGDYRKYFFTKDMLNLPWVTYLGRQGQKDLAQTQMTSSIWLYPTAFKETFCITAAEAGFAKCPIVTSSCFGLKTTARDAGILLTGDPNSDAYKDAFVDQVVKLLTDDVYWEKQSTRAHYAMQKFTWPRIAKQWDDFFRAGEWMEVQNIDVPCTSILDWDDAIGI